MRTHGHNTGVHKQLCAGDSDERRLLPTTHALHSCWEESTVTQSQSPPSGFDALPFRQQRHCAPRGKHLRWASYSPAWRLHVLIYDMGTLILSTSSKCVDSTRYSAHALCSGKRQHQLPRSPWHHQHPRGDRLCWGLPCALKGIWLHPRPLPTRRQGHPYPQTTQAVSSHCQVAPGGQNSSSGGPLS